MPTPMRIVPLVVLLAWVGLSTCLAADGRHGAAAKEPDDAEAQLNLGRMYANGRGVAKDLAEAAKWFRKAAEQNNATAQYNLGLCYADGEGVPKDDVEAAKWFHRAAGGGSADAMFIRGVCYERGNGVPQDDAQAAKWYREAAEAGNANAMYSLGLLHDSGRNSAFAPAEAVRWYRKAANAGNADAMLRLGLYYELGNGVPMDMTEALKWHRKAADAGNDAGMFRLGLCYEEGEGVAKDHSEAVKWYRRAVDGGNGSAMFRLGLCYEEGVGVAKDYVEAYRWRLLAAAQGLAGAKAGVAGLEARMTREQIAEGQKLARDFKPREAPPAGGDSSAAGIAQTRPESSGTGFFITEDGYMITNEHVAGNGAQVRLVTAAGLIVARVVKVDAANDLALLKAEGKFIALPVVASRSARLGATVATVGFPNIGMQGFAPKLAKGEIASLTGPADDARYFQISVPVQPGNSGGALVDERGNVVGVVSAKLNARAALAATGALPENVNYAVKSSFLLSFLESVPEVAAKLKDPALQGRKFEDVVKSAEQAAVLVLVY